MARRSAAATVVLGATCAIPFFSLNDSNVPTAPDAAPTYQIRAAAGLGDGTNIATGTSSAVSGITGAYYISHAITSGNGFAAGTNYYILITYAISAATKRQIIDMTVA